LDGVDSVPRRHKVETTRYETRKNTEKKDEKLSIFRFGVFGSKHGASIPNEAIFFSKV
jgi:hypothetical protein